MRDFELETEMMVMMLKPLYNTKTPLIRLWDPTANYGDGGEHFVYTVGGR